MLTEDQKYLSEKCLTLWKYLEQTVNTRLLTTENQNNNSDVDLDSLLIKEKVDSMKIKSKMFNAQNESSFALPSLEYKLQQIRCSLEQIKLTNISQSFLIDNSHNSVKEISCYQSTSSLGVLSNEVKEGLSNPPEISSTNTNKYKPVLESSKLIGLASMQNKRKTQSYSKL